MSKPIGQKISLFFAVLSYIAAVGCVIAAIFFSGGTEQDPIRAAFMASVVFFVGCGVVLQVIGTTKLKGILSGSGDHDPEK